MNSINDREAAIAQMAKSDEEIAALRKHVKEIIEGPAFKGSHRCAQFLTYVVDRSLAGQFDSLKERVIAIELFGRSGSYDPNIDAIVRVTASDVRKRLLQHYGKEGAAAEFRVSLPLGSYIPEIIETAQRKTQRWDGDKPHLDQPVTLPESAPVPIAAGETAVAAGEAAPRAKQSSNRAGWFWIAMLLAALNLGVWAVVRWPHWRTGTAPPAVLPWSAIFASNHPDHLITSDPDIAGIQILTGRQISVSDYANHKYIPDDVKLSPVVRHFCMNMLSGDKAATIDAQIASNVAQIAARFSRTIDVQGARNLRFSDLRTDDNFIFLGSPASNPWFSAFNNQLDFRFENDRDTGEMIRNLRPRPNEQPYYRPTAKGGATGESYAIIALIGNPNQSGQILLLAGADSEGTQAAGKLATDLPSLSADLQNCGITSSTPLRHFEMLLRVHTMAGYPSQFEVAACHALAGGTPH